MMEEDQAPAEITAEILIDYYNMGLKLVPLNKEGEPLYSWTDIYENPDYWTPESLREHVNDFKYGVATVFGKTRIKDENGQNLYLHCYDNDSENAYNAVVMNTSFIQLMKEKSLVVKTRKPFGFHDYWLSREQHEPVLNGCTKSGWEFEILRHRLFALFHPLDIERMRISVILHITKKSN